jgi:hypothetical protein
VACAIGGIGAEGSRVEHGRVAHLRAVVPAQGTVRQLTSVHLPTVPIFQINLLFKYQ